MAALSGLGLSEQPNVQQLEAQRIETSDQAVQCRAVRKGGPDVGNTAIDSHTELSELSFEHVTGVTFERQFVDKVRHNELQWY